MTTVSRKNELLKKNINFVRKRLFSLFKVKPNNREVDEKQQRQKIIKVTPLKKFSKNLKINLQNTFKEANR